MINNFEEDHISCSESATSSEAGSDDLKPTPMPAKAAAVDDKPKVSLFDRGFVPEKIAGACQGPDNQQMLIMAFQNTDKIELISPSVAREKFPQLLIEYYEQIMTWDSPKKATKF